MSFSSDGRCPGWHELVFSYDMISGDGIIRLGSKFLSVMQVTWRALLLSCSKVCDLVCLFDPWTLISVNQIRHSQNWHPSYCLYHHVLLIFYLVRIDFLQVRCFKLTCPSVNSVVGWYSGIRKELWYIEQILTSHLLHQCRPHIRPTKRQKRLQSSCYQRCLRIYSCAPPHCTLRPYIKVHSVSPQHDRWPQTTHLDCHASPTFTPLTFPIRESLLNWCCAWAGK